MAQKGRGKKNGKMNGRSRATRQLAQGAAAVTSSAFGRSSPPKDLRVWDAKSPQHLPLPRAVGPYTTIRATRRMSSSDLVAVFGTCQKYTTYNNAGNWSQDIAFSSVNAALAINATNNCYATTVPLDSLGDSATMVPSAFSVQLMNPEALQTTTGVVYAGRMNTQAAFGSRTDTWTAVAENFVEFQNPRILTAGKLALRGVQIDSMPLNMSEVSLFTPQAKSADRTFSWDTETEPVGFAPIMVYNPQGIGLEYLVTVEYRVRFDLSHPASAGHRHHPVASDSTWDALMRRATAMGNGVLDIADIVANVGQSVEGAIPRVQRALQGAGTLRRAQLALTAA